MENLIKKILLISLVALITSYLLGHLFEFIYSLGFDDVKRHGYSHIIAGHIKAVEFFGIFLGIFIGYKLINKTKNIKIRNNISNDKFFYSSFFPTKEIYLEYFRPWKLVIFFIGMAILFYGAFFLNYPDWDIGVSIIMGTLTYLTAPWCVSTLIKAIYFKPSKWIFHVLLCLFIAWAVIDGSYFSWHTLVGNTMIRYGNFLASSYLYFFAGFIWLYKGTIKDLYYDCKNNLNIIKL